MSLVFAFLVTVLMGIYVNRQYPKETLADKRFRIISIIFHAVGLFSLLILFLHYRFLSSEALQDCVLFLSSIYFVLICCMGIQYLLINGVQWLLKRFGRAQIRKRFIHIIVFALALTIAVTGYVNSLHLTATRYDVMIDKPCAISKLDVAVMTDLHLGAGMTAKELTQAVAQVNAEKPDVVLIVGDLIDETTSAKAAEDAAQKLSELDAHYGVYFSLGNHDTKSTESIDALLEKAGIRKLDNSAVMLADAVNLVGQSCEARQAVDLILSESGMDAGKPTIVLQHIPRQLKQIAESGADLILCGHTHGYHYPFGGLVLQFWNDLVYGQRKFDNALAITSSGAAAWGFHYKFPSDDEIVMLHIQFAEEE